MDLLQLAMDVSEKWEAITKVVAPASGPGVPTAKKSRCEEDRRASCYGSAQNGFDL